MTVYVSRNLGLADGPSPEPEKNGANQEQTMYGKIVVHFSICCERIEFCAVVEILLVKYTLLGIDAIPLQMCF